MNVLEQIDAPPQAPAMALGNAVRSRGRALLGALALLIVVGCGIAIAIDSAAAPSRVVAGSARSFPGWLSGPLGFLGGSQLTSATYSALTLAMLIAYLVVVGCSRWIGLRWALAAIGVLHAFFLLTPPLASTDIWNYIGYSHLGALHGLSPYDHVPAAVPHDAAFHWVTWPTYKTPYGPLFTIVTYATAPLGVAGGLWTLKLGLGAAALGSLWLVWRCAGRLGLDPVPGLLLVGLSPAWLIWTVGGAHNDVLMLLVALGGISLWLAGRDLWAAFLIVIAAGFKMPAVLLLPFLFVRSKQKRRVAIGVAGGVAFVAVSSLIAFGSLGPLTAFQRQNAFHSNRSILGEIFRLFSAPQSTSGAQTTVTILLVIAIVALIAWVRRGGNPLAAAGWAFVALLAELLWEFPWYVAWLLPLAALSSDRRLKVAALTLSAVLLLAYVSPSMFIVT